MLMSLGEGVVVVLGVFVVDDVLESSVLLRVAEGAATISFCG